MGITITFRDINAAEKFARAFDRRAMGGECSDVAYSDLGLSTYYEGAEPTEIASNVVAEDMDRNECTAVCW